MAASMLGSKAKHYLHCLLFVTVIFLFEIFTGGIRLLDSAAFVLAEDINPWVEYGFLGALVLYVLRLVTFLPLPQVMFNFVGLMFYNAFPDKVQLTGSPLLAPFICIRVVTRGDFPELVKSNVTRNLNKCLDAGLENFLIEVSDDTVCMFVVS